MRLPLPPGPLRSRGRETKVVWHVRQRRLRRRAAFGLGRWPHADSIVGPSEFRAWDRATSADPLKQGCLEGFQLHETTEHVNDVEEVARILVGPAPGHDLAQRRVSSFMLRSLARRIPIAEPLLQHVHPRNFVCPNGRRYTIDAAVADVEAM